MWFCNLFSISGAKKNSVTHEMGREEGRERERERLGESGHIHAVVAHLMNTGVQVEGT